MATQSDLALRLRLALFDGSAQIRAAPRPEILATSADKATESETRACAAVNEGSKAQKQSSRKPNP